MVILTREEKRTYCRRLLEFLPELRRVLQLSQARFSELCGLSRARLIQLEQRKVQLTWGQLTSILCLCCANIRAKEYLYVNEVLPPRFWQFIQQKEENIPPDTNVCVPKELIPTYEQLKEYNRTHPKGVK